MNKKILLGIGSLAAAALPVSVVVACNDEDKKDVIVTVASPTKVKATVAGSKNAYTLTYVNGNDTASKAELETAFKGMVKKAAKDDKTVTFAGSWDTAFNGTTDGTYIYTVTADGYNSVTFTVSVTPATWAWDKPLPAGPYYETATAGEYTVDKTKGNGYAAGTPGTVATITTPSAATTITIDGATYTYNVAGSGFKYFSKPGTAARYSFPTKKGYKLKSTELHNFLTTILSNTSVDSAVQAMIRTPIDLYILDSTTYGFLGHTVADFTKDSATLNKSTILNQANSSTSKKVFFYDSSLIPEMYYGEVSQVPAGWDKTLPSKLYETSTQKTYTIDETKANGYAAETMPTVTKTQAQFETQIKAAPTSNTVKIDGTTYTYTKQ